MTDIFSNIFNLEQTSYWLLVIWWLGAGFVIGMMPKKEVLIGGRRQQQWYWFAVVLMVLPYVLWTGYRPFFTDTSSYVRSFNKSAATLSAIPNVIRTSEDWGFYSLMVVMKCFGVQTHQTFFLIMGAFQIWCMAYIFRRYSTSFWTSFFLFIASTDYLSWMHNGMRQFTAVCITFAAFDLLVRRKYFWFIVVTLIASTFHGSAVLMLPFAYLMAGPALSKKTLLPIGAIILMIPMMDTLAPVMERLLSETQYNDVVGGEIWIADDGTSLMRVLVYSVPALISLAGFRYFRGCKDRAVNMCINATLITMVVYLVSSVTSGIYIGRIPIYTTLHGYIILPWMIDQIFEKQTAKLINVLMVGLYLAFFVYQLKVWGQL